MAFSIKNTEYDIHKGENLQRYLLPESDPLHASLTDFFYKQLQPIFRDTQIKCFCGAFEELRERNYPNEKKVKWFAGDCNSYGENGCDQSFAYRVDLGTARVFIKGGKKKTPYDHFPQPDCVNISRVVIRDIMNKWIKKNHLADQLELPETYLWQIPGKSAVPCDTNYFVISKDCFVLNRYNNKTKFREMAVSDPEGLSRFISLAVMLCREIGYTNINLDNFRFKKDSNDRRLAIVDTSPHFETLSLFSHLFPIKIPKSFRIRMTMVALKKLKLELKYSQSEERLAKEHLEYLKIKDPADSHQFEEAKERYKNAKRLRRLVNAHLNPLIKSMKLSSEAKTCYGVHLKQALEALDVSSYV